MLYKLIFTMTIFCITNYDAAINFTHHTEKISLHISKEKRKELSLISLISNINQASFLLSQNLPYEIEDIAIKIGNCLNEYPIKNREKFSSYTLYSVYDDLARYCILQEYNKQRHKDLTIDEISLIIFNWADEVGLVIFKSYDSKNILLKEYIKQNMCSTTLFFHLLITSLYKKNHIVDFSFQEFLNYLNRNEGLDSEEMCSDFLEFFKNE